MAFHKMASGHFAYVINESGNRQLVTQEQFEDCCCPAPCACPCVGTWPPSTWPCGELLETYLLSFTTSVPSPVSGSREYRPLSSTVLTATASAPLSSGDCDWSSLSVSIEQRVHNGSTWGTWTGTTVNMYINHKKTATCGWSVNITAGLSFIGGIKVVGQTPIGSYANSAPNFIFNATVS